MNTPVSHDAVPSPRSAASRMQARLAMFALCAAALIAPAAAWAQSTNTTTTTSISSSEVLHDSTDTQRVDTYATQIVGRIEGGPTLFDQTYSFAYGSGQVAAGIGDAQAALASYFGANPFSLFGPTQLGSTQSLVGSVSGAPVVISTSTTETVTIEETIGPATTFIGDRDLGGTPFLVLTGTSNINFHTHTQFDIFRTITTTDTYQTVASYEIIGRPVPEPSTWILLASGLALLGWRARRRSRSSRATPSGAISIAPYAGGHLVVMLMVCATGLIVSAGAWAQSTSNTTFTVSTSSSEVLHDSTDTQRVDTYATQIVGRIAGGPTLFDQTYSFAYGSGQVAAGIGDAQAALASYFGANPFSLFGPAQLGLTQSLVGSVTGAPGVTSTTTTQTFTVETQIGPGTILIGNRDLGGTPFIVLTGTQNFNTNVHTQFDIFRTITVTDTYQTVASYEIVGRPVPEPSTWALLAGGLALLGWRARRRGTA